MIHIDNELIRSLLAQAAVAERKRINYDLRTSASDNSQRMLNALLPGTVVPVHRHPNSNENVVCLMGRLVEIIFEEDSDGSGPPQGVALREKDRFLLDPSVGNFGCVVPAGAWHTVEVLEPTVIYEVKDGRYGEDGSVTLDEP